MRRSHIAFCALLLTSCRDDSKPVASGTVGSAPTVFINTPSDGEMIPPGATFELTAILYDEETDAADLVLSVESSTSGAVDFEGATDDAGAFSAVLSLESGEQTLTLTAVDEEGLSGFDSVELVINGSPGAPVVGTDPATVDVGESFQGVILEEAVDPDGDSVTYSWEWSVQADPEATAVPYSPPGSDTEIPADLTGRGQVWTVTATPFDERGNEGESGSASVLIGNGAPSVASAVLEPDPAYTDDMLGVTLSGWEDPDDDPENYLFEWTVNGAIVEGSDSSSLDSTVHSKGDDVAVTVTPFDGYASGTPVTAGPLTIQNTPPSAFSVNIMPAEPTTTADLSVVPLGWSDADGDLEQYQYRWFIDGIEVLGETTESLSSDLTEHFQEVQVELTPFDGEDLGEPILSDPVVIGNTAPALFAVILRPIFPTTLDAIGAEVSGWSDIDGDEPGYIYAWTVNGVDAPTTSPAISPSLTQRGDSIQATVTPTDGVDFGEPVASDPVIVVNSPPSVAFNQIAPDVAVYGDTLTCTWSMFIDADSDPDLSTVTWEVDGVTAGTGSTLTGGFLGGQTVTCILTPYDGYDAGSPVEDSIVIGNTVPSIDNVEIAPDPAYAESSLACTWSGYTDVDLDADESTLQWTINGNPAGTASPLEGGFIDGDVVECTVTPRDAEGAGTPLSSSITISTTQPSITTATITPETAAYNDTLTCSWDGYSDADGDPDESTVEWQNEDGSILGTETTLAGAFVGGDLITCVVTPFDGKDPGTPVRSDAIIIVNSPPVLEDVSLTPVEPRETDTLVCAPGVTTDPDGTTSFSYTYRWRVAGVIVPGATGSTLTGSDFDRGHSVACLVTPSDGSASGDEVMSNTVTILNSRPQIDSLTISPTTANTNTVFTASVTASDADGDAIFVDYEWRVNGIVELEGEGIDTFNGAIYFDKHDEISVKVTPNDTTDYGTPVVSDSIIVDNTPPTSPTVNISPETHEPGDDFSCDIVVDGTDIDDDTVTYTYEWYLDGSLTSHSTDTISGSITIHDQHWECVATSTDGEDSGGSDSDTVVVNDLTDPDPPQFDDLIEHTNETETTLTGDCEPACVLDLYCEDDDGTDVYTGTCDALGRFAEDIAIPRGDISSCVATCTDVAGNVSGPSTAHEVESCNPYDIYEDSETYGDSAADVIDEWATLSDDGGTFISIKGNVLDEDDDDWYVISTSDDLSADIAAGIDYFNFNVELITGTDDFEFVVHHNGTGAGDLECPAVDGYTEYNWFVEDVGDGIDGIPSDTRLCSGSTVYGLNHCEDNSGEFYVHVYRVGGTEVSCGTYELQISNGVW